MIVRTSLGLAAATLLLAACGEDPMPNTAAPAAAMTAPATAPAAPPALMRKTSPSGAIVYVIEPANGAVVTSPVRVVFGLKGAGVAPAGIDLPNTGHHHLLLDTSLARFDLPIPADAQHRHFGGGQTEATVELAPGRHALQLVLADYLHIPHDPPLVSAVVTVEVMN